MLLSTLLICLIYSVIGIPQARVPEQPTCGKSKYSDAGEYELPKPFIVGGIEARRHEFPWQVGLSYDRHFQCGGSIINDRWILTAAHCTSRRKPKLLTLLLGDHIRSDNDNPNRRVISAEKIFNHPNYEFPKYDIGLIKTSEPIIFDENVSPICLPKSRLSYVHKKAVVSGWGKTLPGGDVSDTLMHTTMNTTTNEYCQRLLNLQITKDMICATDNLNDKERSFCGGDSGGPLALKDSNGIFSIIGVVSYVREGCANGYPPVFSRVNHVLDWISETIEK